MIGDSWRAAWLPREPLPATRWLPEHYFLSSDVEAGSGPYDLEDNPQWEEIIAAFDNPDVVRVTIMASTQVGKTLTLLACMACSAVQDPAPALVCTPNRDSAVELRDRFYANALESPLLRRRVPIQRNWNTRHIDMRDSRIYLAWSGSAQRLRGRACRRVFLTEIDVYRKAGAGNPIKAAEERTKRFHRKKIWMESTPVGDDSPISKEYEAGDQRKWHARCPDCGKYQELRFFPYKHGDLAGRGGFVGYKDHQEELLPIEKARQNVRYCCVNGCLIGDDRKRSFVNNGKWVRKGQRIDKAGQVIGEPEKSSRIASFHLWSIHSAVTSFADIVESYILHHDQGTLVDFFQDWLGLPHGASRRMPEWRRLGRALAVHYRRCYLPADGWFLTAGLDVQENGIYYVIRAWGHAVRSWLVDWGFIRRYSDGEPEGTIASDLVEIERIILARRFQIEDGETNPLGKSEIGVKLAGIDSGYRPLDVHQWMQLLRGRSVEHRMRATKGDIRVRQQQRFSHRVVEKNTRTGQEYEGGFHQWAINVNAYKDDLRDRFVDAIEGRGKSFFFPDDILDLGADYLKQLVNENRSEEIDRYGRKKLVWKVINNRIGNHYWDAEIIARAMADMVLADLRLDWNSANWPRQVKRNELPADMGVYR